MLSISPMECEFVYIKHGYLHCIPRAPKGVEMPLNLCHCYCIGLPYMKTDTSEVDWAREQPTYRGEKPVTCNIGPQFLGDYAIQNTIKASIIGGE